MCVGGGGALTDRPRSQCSGLGTKMFDHSSTPLNTPDTVGGPQGHVVLFSGLPRMWCVAVVLSARNTESLFLTRGEEGEGV